MIRPILKRGRPKKLEIVTRARSRPRRLGVATRPFLFYYRTSACGDNHFRIDIVISTAPRIIDGSGKNNLDLDRRIGLGPRRSWRRHVRVTRNLRSCRLLDRYRVDVR